VCELEVSVANLAERRGGCTVRVQSNGLEGGTREYKVEPRHDDVRKTPVGEFKKGLLEAAAEQKSAGFRNVGGGGGGGGGKMTND